MKILAFTDLHGDKVALNKIINRAKKEKIDLLICAGDLSNFGYNLKKLVLKLAQTKIPLLIIASNHDFEDELKNICLKLDSVIYLDKTSYQLNEYLFFGYGGGGFSHFDKEFENLAKKFKKTIRNNLKIILVTHAPPYGTSLDKLDHVGYCGSKSISNFIKEVKPILNICGHLHENANKKDKINKTLIINPGKKGEIINI